MYYKNLRLGKILIKWLQGMLELLSFFPVIFTIGIWLIPKEIWIWISSLAFFYLIGLILGRYLLKKPRYTHFISELIITSLFAWLLADSISLIVLIITFGCVILDRSIRFSGMPWDHMFPVIFLWIGLLIYLAAGLIYNFVPVLQPYFSYLAWAGLAYMITTLFIINSEQLKTAYLPEKNKAPAVSSLIQKNNRILVLLTMALVGIVSNFNRLREWVTKAFKELLKTIIRIILYILDIMYKPVTGTDQPPGQDSIDMLPQEIKEPHWIFKVLELLFIIIAIIMVFILLWYGIRILYKLCKKLFNHLMSILKDRLSFQEETGYIDEKESLMSFADIGKDYMNRFQTWIKKLMEREPKWEELVDNHEKIRFLYRNLILKCIKGGYIYKEYLTPKEIGRDIQDWIRKKDDNIDDLINIYDTIRYGSKDIDDKKVNKLAEKLLRDD